MDIKTAISRTVQHLDLGFDEMAQVMRQIMTGQVTPAQISAFLVALRMKGESVEEIAAAATVMRELADHATIEADHLVDIVGTGGDGANLFNVSTAAAFVVAAAGGSVAKHGNRSVSSSSGSADLLEIAGVNLMLNPAQVTRCVEQLGIGFLFAPQHHSAMKYTVAPRKEVGIRTFMNILGPLTNPANAPNLLVGVFTRELCRPLAEVFQRLGNRHVMVVSSLDGLDEISLAAPTQVAELKDNAITEYPLKPEQLGINSTSLIGLEVDSPAASLALVQDALGGQQTNSARKAADMIAINAGAAIYVAGVADSLTEGVKKAQTVIHNGSALTKMKQLAAFSHGDSFSEHHDGEEHP